MKNNTLMTIVLVIVVAAGAFYAGMKYQGSQQSALSGQYGNGMGTRIGGQNSSRGRFGAGGRQVIGEILNLDDKSLTVKLQDGSTKIVLLSGTTTVVQTSQAAKTDLKVGDKVGVFGSQNTDGSVTAQNIQLNPIMRGGGGPGAASSAAATK